MKGVKIPHHIIILMTYTETLNFHKNVFEGKRNFRFARRHILLYFFFLPSFFHFKLQSSNIILSFFNFFSFFFIYYFLRKFSSARYFLYSRWRHIVVKSNKNFSHKFSPWKTSITSKTDYHTNDACPIASYHLCINFVPWIFLIFFWYMNEIFFGLCNKFVNGLLLYF